MSKTILNMENPVTQSVAAIKSLLAYVGRASDPMPSDVSLDNGCVVLVLSNKKDCYYVATQKACSCPARVWHPQQPCKHQRKHFPQVATVATKPIASEPLIKRGGFKPFDEMPGERVKAKASSLSAVDCFDTRDIDAAYHSIKSDSEMWPLCEA